MAGLVPLESRHPSPTAHDPSKHLGWAEITHPFHPRRGQRYPVVKVRRVAAVESLILRGTSGGTVCVPREWTDRADPMPYADLGIDPLVLDFEHLLALADLLEAITRRGELEKEGVDR